MARSKASRKDVGRGPRNANGLALRRAFATTLAVEGLWSQSVEAMKTLDVSDRAADPGDGGARLLHAPRFGLGRAEQLVRATAILSDSANRVLAEHVEGFREFAVRSSAAAIVGGESGPSHHEAFTRSAAQALNRLVASVGKVIASARQAASIAGSMRPDELVRALAGLPVCPPWALRVANLRQGGSIWRTAAELQLAVWQGVAVGLDAHTAAELQRETAWTRSFEPDEPERRVLDAIAAGADDGKSLNSITGIDRGTLTAIIIPDLRALGLVSSTKKPRGYRLTPAGERFVAARVPR